MKVLHVELTDELAREVDSAVEVVRASLREFISHHRFELMEQQQLQDVAWAVRENAALSTRVFTFSHYECWKGLSTLQSPMSALDVKLLTRYVLQVMDGLKLLSIQGRSEHALQFSILGRSLML